MSVCINGKWEKKVKSKDAIIITVSHYKLNEIESIINFVGSSCCSCDYKSRFCFMGLPGNKNLQYAASFHNYLPYILIYAAFLVVVFCLPQPCCSCDTLPIFRVKNSCHPNF